MGEDRKWRITGQNDAIDPSATSNALVARRQFIAGRAGAPEHRRTIPSAEVEHATA
jgi:hypothetical protein